MFRRVVIVSISIGLMGNLKSATALLIVSHSVYGIYTIVIWPYKEIFVNIFDFICDGVVVVYYISLAAYGEDYSDSKALSLVNFIISA